MISFPGSSLEPSFEIFVLDPPSLVRYLHEPGIGVNMRVLDVSERLSSHNGETGSMAQQRTGIQTSAAQSSGDASRIMPQSGAIEHHDSLASSSSSVRHQDAGRGVPALNSIASSSSSLSDSVNGVTNAPLSTAPPRHSSHQQHWYTHNTWNEISLIRQHLYNLKLFSSFYYSNAIYLFGGRSPSNFLASFFVYRTDKAMWDKLSTKNDSDHQPFATMACASCLVRTTVSGDVEDYFSIFGGITSEEDTTGNRSPDVSIDSYPWYLKDPRGKLYHLSNEMFSFSLQTASWNFMGPDEEDEKEMASWPKARAASTMVWRCTGDSLVLFGGLAYKRKNPRHQVQSRADGVKPNRGRRSRSSKNKTFATGSLGTTLTKRRERGGARILSTSPDEQKELPIEILSEVAEYSLDTNEWEYIATTYVDDRTGRVYPRGIKRCFHSTVIHGSRLFVFGGYDKVPLTLKEPEITDGIYTLDLQLRRWFRIPLLSAAISPLCDTLLQTLHKTHEDPSQEGADDCPQLMISGTMTEGEQSTHHAFLVQMPKYIPKLRDADSFHESLYRMQRNGERADVMLEVKANRKRNHPQTTGDGLGYLRFKNDRVANRVAQLQNPKGAVVTNGLSASVPHQHEVRKRARTEDPATTVAPPSIAGAGHNDTMEIMATIKEAKPVETPQEEIKATTTTIKSKFGPSKIVGEMSLKPDVRCIISHQPQRKTRKKQVAKKAKNMRKIISAWPT